MSESGSVHPGECADGYAKWFFKGTTDADNRYEWKHTEALGGIVQFVAGTRSEIDGGYSGDFWSDETIYIWEE